MCLDANQHNLLNMLQGLQLLLHCWHQHGEVGFVHWFAAWGKHFQELGHCVAERLRVLFGHKDRD